jgi:hypothetical protein
MIGLAFFWLCYAFMILADTYETYKNASIDTKLFSLAVWITLLTLLVSSGIGLMRLKRWARWTALFLNGYNLLMFSFVCFNAFYDRSLIYDLSALPAYASGLIGCWVVWTLLHPQSWKLAWH